jgi:hypothetical protein
MKSLVDLPERRWAYADAVTHKRSAGRVDAELVVAAIESVAKVIGY